MRSPRKALIVLIAAALALPLTGRGYEAVRQPLDRQPEYIQASHVVEGTVKKVEFLNRQGKPDSNGPRFRLDLAVSAVHKPKEKGPTKGDTLSVVGWKTGDQKQTFVPAEKDDVLAFLKRSVKGTTYEPIRPTGFRKAGASLTPAPAGRGSERKKKE